LKKDSHVGRCGYDFWKAKEGWRGRVECGICFFLKGEEKMR